VAVAVRLFLQTTAAASKQTQLPRPEETHTREGLQPPTYTKTTTCHSLSPD
jgi:hypothetical protein